MLKVELYNRFPLRENKYCRHRTSFWCPAQAPIRTLVSNKYAIVIHHAMMISRYFFISAGVSKSRFLEAQDFMAVL